MYGREICPTVRDFKKLTQEKVKKLLDSSLPQALNLAYNSIVRASAWEICTETNYFKAGKFVIIGIREVIDYMFLWKSVCCIQRCYMIYKRIVRLSILSCATQKEKLIIAFIQVFLQVYLN